MLWGDVLVLRQPNQTECGAHFSIAVSHRGKDALFSDSRQAKQTDREVLESCKSLRSIAFSNLGSIFIKGAIADVMQSLNCPVVPIELEDTFGCGFLGRATGDSLDNFEARFSGCDCVDGAFDLEDLPYEREMDILVQSDARPNFPFFDAPMAFFTRLVLRGGNPPSGGLRCLSATWAGCL